MKNMKRIYFILTYMFFIYPPFIWGLVLVYNDDLYEQSHLVTLLINLILIIVIGLICFLMIRRNKLHVPDKEEIKYLLFGFTGNVVMFFYTFQNIMELDRIVTIYLVLLIVLAVHYFLIKRKLAPFELWLLLPLYLVYDYIFVIMTNCGWSDYNCNVSSSESVFLTITFGLIFAITVLYYVYRVLSYRLFDFFKIANMVIIALLSLTAYTEFDLFDQRFIMTLAIIGPFLLIVDFIVKIVNKAFDSKMILFYLRTFTIFIFFTIYGVFRRYGDIDNELLSMMVVATYVSLGISILKSLTKSKVDDGNPLTTLKNTREQVRYLTLRETYQEYIEVIKAEFGNVAGAITLDEDSFTLASVYNDEVKGFVSTQIENINYYPDTKQAHITALAVKDDNHTYLHELLISIERYYRQNGVRLISAELDKTTFIDLKQHGFIYHQLENGKIIFVKKI